MDNLSLSQELINHTEAFCGGVPLTATELKTARSKRHYEANKEEYKEKLKKWRDENRDRVNESERERYAKKARQKRAEERAYKAGLKTFNKRDNPPVMARCKHCFKLVPDGKCNCREAKCDR